MIVVRADFETRSDVNLKTCGPGPYFASKHFRPHMLAYRIADGVMQLWLWGQACPDDLREAIENGCEIHAFNAAFERQCFDWLAENCGWPRPKIEQYVCTAAAAAAMGLPRDLEGVADVLGTKVRKDKRGKQLIQLFCVPRKPHPDEDPAAGPYWNEPEDFPAEWVEFQAYCCTDVETEEAVAERLIPLSDAERAVYTLDQKINSRGLRIDVQSAKAALLLAERAKHELDAEMAEITNGEVTACSQVARLTGWIVSRGVSLETVRRAEIEELLEFDDLADDVRRALELRLEAAKASVSKLKAMLSRVSPDGRLRGAFLYHAAGTGRWSSIGAQLHNLPRPRKVYEKANLDHGNLFDAIKVGQPEWLRELYPGEIGRPLHLLADALRGFIWAAPGHDLLVADYSGIEGAVAAWLAKEDWKIQALREIAADPSLPDLYRRAAAAIMNTTTDVITKDHPLRQSVGKVSELALQYGGGVGAFVSMARGYGVQLTPLYEPVWAAASEERREQALKRYERCLKRGEAKANVLPREAWLACEVIKIGWRAKHPAISGAWGELEEAARDAIAEPGRRFDVLGGAYIMRHGFLWRLLPSGRCLAYASPRLTEQIWCLVDGSDEAETLSPQEIVALRRAGSKVEERGAARPRISVAGVDSQTRKFIRYGLYGGLQFENDVQALARDLLANGMQKAEAAGYPIIGHVHDEPIAEVPRGFGDVSEFEKLICELPSWAEGLPLTASGWRGKRYKK